MPGRVADIQITNIQITPNHNLTSEFYWECIQKYGWGVTTETEMTQRQMNHYISPQHRWQITKSENLGHTFWDFRKAQHFEECPFQVTQLLWISYRQFSLFLLLPESCSSHNLICSLVCWSSLSDVDKRGSSLFFFLLGERGLVNLVNFSDFLNLFEFTFCHKQTFWETESFNHGKYC